MRLFPIADGLPVTRPRQSWYCACASPVVERIALFDTFQCATCWRPFAPGVPVRLAPQSSGEGYQRPLAFPRRTLAVAGGDDREVSRQASTRVAAEPGLTPATAPNEGAS